MEKAEGLMGVDEARESKPSLALSLSAAIYSISYMGQTQRLSIHFQQLIKKLWSFLQTVLKFMFDLFLGSDSAAYMSVLQGLRTSGLKGYMCCENHC